MEQHAALVEELIATLEAGDDVAVGIGWGAGEYQEFAIFPHVVVGLARVLAPVARAPAVSLQPAVKPPSHCSRSLGVQGITVVDEIEPGMCLGLTLGDRSVPVHNQVRAASAIEGAWSRAVERLRLIRQSGTVA